MTYMLFMLFDDSRPVEPLYLMENSTT